jgi:hypothetical protein
MQEGKAVPRDWEAIHRNEPLRREITELMLMASDLNIIDWVKPEAARPRALSWDKTKRTTAKVLGIHFKKRLAIFPSPAGMSQTKLSLAGNN